MRSDTRAVCGGGYHVFALGTGAGQIRWAGSGGFSAYGADRGTIIGNGSTLHWGSANFLQYGDALLLSSRYANANITFVNDINLGSYAAGYAPIGLPPPPPSPEIRVERGEYGAHAIMTGLISSTGGRFETRHGLVKTGRGLLHLIRNNTYCWGDDHQIRRGAR